MKESFNSLKIRHLKLELNSTIFEIFDHGKPATKVSLSIGYQSIAKKYFKNNIPTEAETEYAINDIEDALMSNKSLVNQNEILVVKSKVLANALLKNGLSQREHSRKIIENLFNNFARIIMGSPNTMINTKLSQIDFAVVLILREIMHHLDFDTVHLEN